VSRRERRIGCVWKDVKEVVVGLTSYLLHYMVRDWFAGLLYRYNQLFTNFEKFLTEMAEIFSLELRRIIKKNTCLASVMCDAKSRLYRYSMRSHTGCLSSEGNCGRIQ
jgi:hypothetical protein